MIDPKYRPQPRRRFIEFHEQSYTPAWIRKPVQQLLTIAWTVCFYPLQQISPAELSVEILQGVVEELEGASSTSIPGPRDGLGPKGGDAQHGRADSQTPIGLRKRKALEGGAESPPPMIVDFCSGAGGPLPTIERVMNQRRTASSLSPIPFLLTDLYPANAHWLPLARASPTGSLKFVPESVDATRAARGTIENVVRQKQGAEARSTMGARAKHFRTFFLAFHHFDEESAVRVLEDAMGPISNADATPGRDGEDGGEDGGGAEGVGIFELQTFDFGSLMAINLLWPMSWVVTPFLRPSFTQLIFTYLIPIIPFILVFDGYISAYRSRSPSHIEYLAEQARENIKARTGVEVDEWEWKSGVRRHTWPGGKMYWTVGMRKKGE